MTLKFVFLSLFLVSGYASDRLLKKYCDQYNGVISKKYTCPKSKLTFPFSFCVFENEQKIEQFFDGCTGPSGGHKELFYPHCIKHDLCYHHEPISNGKTQKNCDEELKSGLLNSCEESKNKKYCQKWARAMYLAVRGFGKLAFHCANVASEY